VEKTVQDASARLFAEREKRVRPGRDEKILTSWNGLMISGFARGYAVTGDLRYLDAAKNAIRFIEEKLASPDGRLMRTFKDNQAKLNAYLDDYAFYVAGLLDLFAVDSRPEYLESARKYTDFMVKHFWDEKEGNLFFTSDDHEQLIVRTKSFYDLAIPSGNSVAASNLLRLYHYTQENSYLDKAVAIMKSGAKPAAENPFGFGQLLIAIYMHVKKPVEVTIIREGGMSRWLQEQFLPDGITAFVSEEDLPALQKYAFFKGRGAEKGETAFVCRNFTCSLPIMSEKELARQLGR
jgi:uncharacterized protein YyaL (SSP411 family)